MVCSELGPGSEIWWTQFILSIAYTGTLVIENLNASNYRLHPALRSQTEMPGVRARVAYIQYNRTGVLHVRVIRCLMGWWHSISGTAGEFIVIKFYIENDTLKLRQLPWLTLCSKAYTECWIIKKNRKCFMYSVLIIIILMLILILEALQLQLWSFGLLNESF
jgi:hypothetical protein